MDDKEVSDKSKKFTWLPKEFVKAEEFRRLKEEDYPTHKLRTIMLFGFFLILTLMPILSVLQYGLNICLIISPFSFAAAIITLSWNSNRLNKEKELLSKKPKVVLSGDKLIIGKKEIIPKSVTINKGMKLIIVTNRQKAIALKERNSYISYGDYTDAPRMIDDMKKSLNKLGVKVIEK